MATGQLNGMIGNLRRSVVLRDLDRMADGDLLEAFIASGEEAAFEGIVQRHGPMVFGVCRRILGHTQDAEDAFQAAFLVLAKKANAVQPREMVGNWLYGVAYRTSMKARSMIAKRQAREKQLLDLPDCEAPIEARWSDVQPIIDAELNRLADKYRVPVVLCDLEGKSQRDAAKQLGWPEGTLMTRLFRARQLLAKRLTHKGVALSAGALAALLEANAASAAVPMTLAGSTVKAAALAAAGQTAALVSAEVAALTEGVLHTMFIAKIKSVAIVMLAVAVLGTGGGFFTHWSLPDRSVAGERTRVNQPVQDRNADAANEQDRRGQDRPAVDPAKFSGKIVEVAKDGKSFAIEVPSPNRGEAPGKQEIKVTDKTEYSFSGVGLGGAKLAAGMVAQIWTAEKATDVAAKIVVGGRNDGRLGPDLSGKVVGVSKDGTTLTIEPISRTRREADAVKVDVKLTISTMQTYSGIEKGGAKPTIGYGVEVWLERGSKTNAVAVAFRAGEGERGGRDRIVPRGNQGGRVVGVSKDGKVVTVEMPPAERGAEGIRIDIKLDDKTRVTYVNVPPGGDAPTEGYFAQVSLAENSKDRAASITFAAPHKERLQVLRGVVSGMGKDGKSFAIDVPPTERGQPAEKLRVKITDNTRVIFNGVGLDGARLTEGHQAQIWLEEGSRDTAFQVIFGKTEAGGRGRE